MRVGATGRRHGAGLVHGHVRGRPEAAAPRRAQPRGRPGAAAPARGALLEGRRPPGAAPRRPSRGPGARGLRARSAGEPGGRGLAAHAQSWAGGGAGESSERRGESVRGAGPAGPLLGRRGSGGAGVPPGCWRLSRQPGKGSLGSAREGHSGARGRTPQKGAVGRALRAPRADSGSAAAPGALSLPLSRGEPWSAVLARQGRPVGARVCPYRSRAPRSAPGLLTGGRCRPGEARGVPGGRAVRGGVLARRGGRDRAAPGCCAACAYRWVSRRGQTQARTALPRGHPSSSLADLQRPS